MTSLSAFLRRRSPDWLLALLCWIPLLVVERGVVSADTKTYLSVDPSKVLSEAASLWNPDIGLGTVTHQYVGYLWPMGPYYWLCDVVGLPDWIAQRLWWGALLFLAAAGTRRLARDLGVGAFGAFIAACAYGLSPYSLQYLARLSGLLLAWAALPWMILWVRRIRDDRSWMPPLVLAGIVASAGTMNASALLLVGLGPAAWLVTDVLGGRIARRDTVVFLLRFGFLSAALNAWWVWSLVVQGRYGLPILRYTETYETVAKASSPLELLRGLGYWFFYGGDLRSRWVDVSATYMQNRVVILAGFALLAGGIGALSGLLRRDRTNVAVMMLVGLGVAVGAAPLGDSGPFGDVFLRLVRNEAGFALRSTPRASPIVLLCLGVGVGLMGDRILQIARRPARGSSLRSRLGGLSIAGLAGALLLHSNGHFTARFLTDGVSRPENLPAYLSEAATAIEASAEPERTARVYELPGIDFAAHDWGSTVDPVMASLASASYLARELVPYGSDGTADLLDAHESRLQENIVTPGETADFARLISATAVSWRADLDYAAYRTPRPDQLGAVLSSEPPGPTLMEGPRTTEARPRIVDAQTYALPRLDSTPLHQVWKVDDTRGVADASALDDVVMVSGDGRGLLASIRAGILDPLETVIYWASASRDPRLRQFSSGHVVLTDTNRRSPRRWFTVYSNLGRTETDQIGSPFDDPSDNRLFPFLDDPRADPAGSPQSVTRLLGDIEWIRSLQLDVQAYHTPEDRPEHAFDGDPRTAWRTAALAPLSGHGLEVRLRAPVTVGEIGITLPTEGLVSRRIRSGRLLLRHASTGQARTIPFTLGFGDSHTIPVDGEPFDRLRLLVDTDNLGELDSYDRVPALGIAEIEIPGVASTEWLSVPTVPTAANSRRISIVLERWRTEPSMTNRSDPETHLARLVTLPRRVTGTVTGTVSIGALADEPLVSRVLGLPVAESEARLDVTWRSTAAFAVDGDERTSWISDFDPVGRARIDLSLAVSGASSRSLVMLADLSERHSVPTRITLGDSAGKSWNVELERRAGLLHGAIPDGLTSPVTSIRIDAVDPRTAEDYFTGVTRTLPVRLMEIHAGSRSDRIAPRPDRDCREDLLSIDGLPLPIRILWSDDPVAGNGVLPFESCVPVVIEEGEHRISGTNGRDSGVGIDTFVFTEPAESVPARKVSLEMHGPTAATVRTSTEGAHVLSFAQSTNRGWRAVFDDGESRIDLGRPFVVQGYANGWIVPGPGTVRLLWTPQTGATAAQWLSLLAGAAWLATLMVVWRSCRRRTATTVRVQVPMFDPSEQATRMGSVAIVVGVALFAGPLTALAVVPAFLLTRRTIAGVVGVGVAALGAAVAWAQGVHRYQATLDWPGHHFHLVTATWILVGWALVALAGRCRPPSPR